MAILPASERGSFTYANPEQIRWGAGCVREGLTETLDRLGARRAFVVTTKSVAQNPALLGAVEKLLEGRVAGRFPGITQHAPVREVAQAARAVRVAEADLLLSLGGGSPIDAAKAVAFSLATGLDLLDPQAPSRARGASLAGKRVLPHVAIPTTLSVAELSGAAGFTAEGTLEKTGVAAPELRPAVVLYDAELSLHTPIDLWLSTGIRAVDHAVEGILSAGSHPLSDAAALEGLRLLQESLLATRKDPRDLGARTQSQIGAWLSFLLPGPSSRGLSHTLGKRLGSRHGIQHGVTSCLLLPHVMRYLAPAAQDRLARIASALGVDTSRLNPSEAASRASDAVAQLIADLGLPQHLSAYGLSDADLAEAVRPLATAQHSADALLRVLRAAV